MILFNLCFNACSVHLIYQSYQLGWLSSVLPLILFQISFSFESAFTFLFSLLFVHWIYFCVRFFSLSLKFCLLYFSDIIYLSKPNDDNVIHIKTKIKQKALASTTQLLHGLHKKQKVRNSGFVILAKQLRMI